jgi:copper chaperone CopZ
MRTCFVGMFAALLALGGVAAVASADDVEIKGAHLCCAQCVNVANGLLAKVDGLSEVKADAKDKTITFKSKDEASAKAGIKAIIDGGFFGKVTRDGKEHAVTLPMPTGKANEVVVKDVHVCCGACKTAINKLFADAKVTYEGKGPQLTVRLAGADLDKAAVMATLRKTGFNGNIEK